MLKNIHIGLGGVRAYIKLQIPKRIMTALDLNGLS